ncbi:Protein mago nashi [Entamoeba marina]
MSESPNQPKERDDFFLRYYNGHKGSFGHEFYSFEILGNGELRYNNNTRYRHEQTISKRVILSKLVIQTIKEMIESSKVLELDDSKWPEENEDGLQELEIKYGSTHISFSTCISPDPQGLLSFYYLVQDLRTMVLAMINLHFKVRPTH